MVQLAQENRAVVTRDPSGRVNTTRWNTVPLQVGQQM